MQTSKFLYNDSNEYGHIWLCLLFYKLKSDTNMWHLFKHLENVLARCTSKQCDKRTFGLKGIMEPNSKFPKKNLYDSLSKFSVNYWNIRKHSRNRMIEKNQYDFKNTILYSLCLYYDPVAQWYILLIGWVQRVYEQVPAFSDVCQKISKRSYNLS